MEFISAFAHVAQGLPAIVAAVVVLVLARFIVLRTSALVRDQHLIEDQNAATGIVLGAFLVACALALVGSIFGRRQDDMLIAGAKTLVEGVIAIVLLRASIWVCDRLILKNFCIVKEIREDRNLGVAFCVAGLVLACGLVINGALTGFSRTWLSGLGDIVLFWLIGILVLVLGAIVYQAITRYDVHSLLEFDDNIAVGIGFGAFLVSLGIVLRASMVGAGFWVVVAGASEEAASKAQPTPKVVQKESMEESKAGKKSLKDVTVDGESEAAATETDKRAHRPTMFTEMMHTMVLAIIGVVGVIALQPVSHALLVPKADYEDDVEMIGNIATGIVMACASLAFALLWATTIQR